MNREYKGIGRHRKRMVMIRMFSLVIVVASIGATLYGLVMGLTQ